MRLFTIFVCAGILGMYVWQTWWAWDVENNESKRNAANVADGFSQHADSTFEAADAVLEVLQLWSEMRGTGRSQRASLQRLLSTRLRALPQLHALFLFDETGNPIVNTLAPTSALVNVRDRAYFRYHQTHALAGSHLGVPVISRYSGKWVITLSRRISDAHGSFRGIAAATLSLGYFDGIYGHVDLGHNGTIALLLDNGTVVVRKPFDPRYIGTSVVHGTLFRHMQAAPAGEFTAASIIDGIERLTAYRHLDHFPMVTAVAIPTDDLFGPWRRASIIGFASVCALIAAIVLLARLLVTAIRHSEQAQQQLTQLAFLDGLTELANRRRFDTALEIEWRRGLRDRTPLALLMIDADLFKSFNDRYGHQMGDDVLRTIAECIRGSLARPSDLGVRYGGEEFAVLLPATSSAGARIVGEKIRASLGGMRLPHADNSSGSVTVSIGVAAMVPARAGSSADLLGASDAALYKAKSSGRDRIDVAPGAAATA